MIISGIELLESSDSVGESKADQGVYERDKAV